jgi:transposase
MSSDSRAAGAVVDECRLFRTTVLDVYVKGVVADVNYPAREPAVKGGMRRVEHPTEGLTRYAYDARRGKAAMDEIGILPQFRGTLVRDGYLSYSHYEQCCHSLCNAHLLRELVFIEEVDPTQKRWTAPLSKLLVKIKDAAADDRAASAVQLKEKQQAAWLRRYAQLVRKAAKINPVLTLSQQKDEAPKKQRSGQPTPRNLIARLHRRRDEVLRFMTDLSAPFDNNGSERDLRMIKLQQQIAGCFRTANGAREFCRLRSYLWTARNQGYSLLSSLERVMVGKPLVFQ